MLRWKLGVTPEASTVGRSAMRRSALITSRLSQPAWHVTRMARSPWRMDRDGVLSAWQGHRHIAVLPDQLPPMRRTRLRRSGLGLLLTMGMTAQFDPTPLPLVLPFSLTEVLGNHRSAGIRICASLGITNDKGFPDSHPLRIGPLLFDTGKAGAECVRHGVDAPGLTLLKPDCSELSFPFAIGQAACWEREYGLGDLDVPNSRPRSFRDR